jgi:hypothetical protein
MQTGTAELPDADMRQYLDLAMRRGNISAETTSKRLECCLDADLQIDRNANQATLVEAWLDRLSGS